MLNFSRLKPSWVVGAILVWGAWGIWFLYKSDFITQARNAPLWLWIYFMVIMIIMARVKDERKKLALILSISGAVLLTHYLFNWPEFYAFKPV